MKSILIAAREGDWGGCGVALVAALEELPKAEAHCVTEHIVDLLQRNIVDRSGKWMQFVERAADSLASAQRLPDPDRLVALASAVKDATAAVAMQARQAQTNSALRPSLLSQLKLSSFGLRRYSSVDLGRASYSLAARTRDQRSDLWSGIHEMLARMPALKDTVGRGVYQPGKSHNFALRAAEAGII